MNDRETTALDLMKKATRDTFLVCVDTLENVAAQIEANKLGKIDAVTALRLVAGMFRASAEHE